MRWIRLTDAEITDREFKRKTNWHRKFALIPRWDKDSRIVYWLERVWCKAKERTHMGRYEGWEYRGGGECPDVKLPPPVTEPAPTPHPALITTPCPDQP